MAASLGALYSAGRSVRCHTPRGTSKSARPCSVSMGKSSQPLKAGITISRRSGESRAISREKLDEWMRDSVVEIVKNLRQAPLLLQVLPETSGDAKVELRMQRAVAEADWKAARAGWEEGEAPMPEGVIFVEELVEDEEDDDNDDDRVWGIAVQGRGSECASCYLLKTTRVESGVGVGLCCTHFCLMKVTSFREKPKTQFNKCWLVQDHR